MQIFLVCACWSVSHDRLTNVYKMRSEASNNTFSDVSKNFCDKIAKHKNSAVFVHMFKPLWNVTTKKLQLTFIVQVQLWSQNFSQCDNRKRQDVSDDNHTVTDSRLTVWMHQWFVVAKKATLEWSDMLIQKVYANLHCEHKWRKKLAQCLERRKCESALKRVLLLKCLGSYAMQTKLTESDDNDVDKNFPWKFLPVAVDASVHHDNSLIFTPQKEKLKCKRSERESMTERSVFMKRLSFGMVRQWTNSKSKQRRKRLKLSRSRSLNSC